MLRCTPSVLDSCILVLRNSLVFLILTQCLQVFLWWTCRLWNIHSFQLEVGKVLYWKGCIFKKYLNNESCDNNNFYINCNHMEHVNKYIWDKLNSLDKSTRTDEGDESREFSSVEHSGFGLEREAEVTAVMLGLLIVDPWRVHHQ